MTYIIDILQTSIIIYFSFVWIYESKSKKFNALYPVAILMLCIIVFLTNYNDFVNLIAVFLLYFLLPLFLLEFSCKKTVYLCMFNVGLLSLLNCIFNMIIILFYSKQFDNVLSYLLINLIVTFIVIIVLSIRSIRLYLREFYS